MAFSTPISAVVYDRKQNAEGTSTCWRPCALQVIGLRGCGVGTIHIAHSGVPLLFFAFSLPAFIYFYFRCCVRPPEKYHYTRTLTHIYSLCFITVSQRLKRTALHFLHPYHMSTTLNPCVVGPAKILSTETKYKQWWCVSTSNYYGSAFN